jgi:hypothetical protein
MTQACRAAATSLAVACVALSLSACKPTVTRLDHDIFVLDTRKISAERFLDVLSNRLSGTWGASDYAPPDADPSKMYTFEGSRVTVVLIPMPHNRCKAGPHHLSFDNAYRVDIVYRTSDRAKRATAKLQLLQAASDVGERLTKFEECPRD